MGCDIHFHIELKDKEGVWHHYSSPWIDRNYSLFSFLAGVRGLDIKPIKANNDIFPINTSLITKINYNQWKEDAHNLRVFNYDDIQQIYKRWNEYNKNVGIHEYFSSSFHDILHTNLEFQKFDGEFEEGSILHAFQDVRFIFWFDN
jgi:hypothetical protein